MANETPSGRRRASQPGRGIGARPIEKSTVEVRQGRRGQHVLYILAISLALAILAGFVIYFYHAQ